MDIISIHEKFDKVYGLDPVLYNGIKYIQNQPGVLGTAFLDARTSPDCAIILNGRLYDNLILQYDVYQQVFVLSYSNFVGANEQIVVNPGKNDTILIRGKTFIRNSYIEIEQPFIQILGKSDAKALISYAKYYRYNGMGKTVGFEYSQLDSWLYFEINNKIYPIRNKKSFVKLFPESYKKEASMFLKKNKIKFRKLNEGDVQSLLTILDYTELQ